MIGLHCPKLSSKKVKVFIIPLLYFLVHFALYTKLPGRLGFGMVYVRLSANHNYHELG